MINGNHPTLVSKRLIVKTRLLVHKILALLLLTTVVIYPCAACNNFTEVAVSSHINTSNHVDIGKVVGAILIYDNQKNPDDYTYIALVFDTGKIELLRNAWVWHNNAHWTDAGLYYVDKHKNYFISNSSGKIQSTNDEKDADIYGSISVDNSHVLNSFLGSFEGKTRRFIEITSSAGTKEFATIPTQEILSNLAQCGTDIYGFTESQSSTSSEDYDAHLSLYKLSSGPKTVGTLHQTQTIHSAELKPDITRSVRHPYSFAVNMDDKIACLDDKIYVILSIFGGEATAHTLLTWDITNNEYSLLPLIAPDGKQLGSISRDDNSYFMTAQSPIINNTLILFDSESGKILLADITNGKTQELAAGAHIQGVHVSYSVWANEHRIYRCAISRVTNPGLQSRIDVFDRTSGELLKTVKLDDCFTQYLKAKETYMVTPTAFNPREPLFQ